MIQDGTYQPIPPNDNTNQQVIQDGHGNDLTTQIHVLRQHQEMICDVMNTNTMNIRNVNKRIITLNVLLIIIYILYILLLFPTTIDI